MEERFLFGMTRKQIIPVRRLLRNILQLRLMEKKKRSIQLKIRLLMELRMERIKLERRRK